MEVNNIMDDLISIVLPVYNGEKYLRESIDSILSQTYKNWELLILDDCSTDKTSEIAKEYEAKDERIRYFKNDINLRLPRNLNKGFSLTKGDYLTWTSDDNRFRPQALEKMHEALVVDGKAQFVFASCRVINSEGNAIEYITVNDSSKKKIKGMNSVGACFMYTRKVYEVIGDYDPELTLVEDLDYWQRICARFDAITISDILYEYRWHDGALTSTMRKDTFNRTLEKTLLKNQSTFGKMDNEEKYYLYTSLYTCRKELGDKENPYEVKYKWYSLIYMLRYRIPRKIMRMMHRR